jgi:predicted nucleotidyltransferase
MSIIDQNIDIIRRLCEQHYVSQLAVFGSILTDKFDKNSDIDLLVDFSNIDLENKKLATLYRNMSGRHDPVPHSLSRLYGIRE